MECKLRNMKLCLTVCLTSFVGSSWAQGLPDPKPYIAEAFQASPALKAAMLSVDIASKGREIDSIKRLPDVSMGIEASTNSDSANRVVRVEQSLWRGGISGLEEERTELAVSTAQVDVANTKLQVALTTTAAWIDFNAAVASEALYSKHLDRLQQLSTIIERRVQADLGTKTETSLVAAQVIQTRTELRAVTGRRDAARQRLSIIIGRAPVADGSFLDSKQLMDLKIDPDYHVLSMLNWSELVQSLPQIIKSRLQSQIDQSDAKISKAASMPEVYARLDIPLSSGSKSAAFVGVRYSGRESRTSLVKSDSFSMTASERLLKMQSDIDDINTQLNKETVALGQARDQLSSARQALEIATSIKESYLRQFTVSRKTWSDVMAAAQDVFVKERQLLDLNVSALSSIWKLNLYHAAASNQLDGYPTK